MLLSRQPGIKTVWVKIKFLLFGKKKIHVICSRNALNQTPSNDAISRPTCESFFFFNINLSYGESITLRYNFITSCMGLQNNSTWLGLEKKKKKRAKIHSYCNAAVDAIITLPLQLSYDHYIYFTTLIIGPICPHE